MWVIFQNIIAYTDDFNEVKQLCNRLWKMMKSVMKESL